MPAILALIAEIMSLVPQIASAGISLSGIYAKVRTVLDENSAPDDPTWNALDAQVNSLKAQLDTDPPSP